MANQLQIAGAQAEKPAKYAPLHVAQMFTGYWPNSSPLRDAAVPFLYQKFYSASRNDKIVAGLNMEISPRMTLVRRPGHSVYNSQNFTGLQQFYSFKPFLPGVGEQVIVMADTASTVYNATGPSTKTAIFSKSVGAGISRFKGVEDTLFWGDGVDIEKWSWFPSWVAHTNYASGTVVLDSSNNMQQSIGLAAAVVSTSVTSNVLTVNYTVASGFTPSIGEHFLFYGMTGTPTLNGVTVTVLTTGSGTFTASGFITADYGTTSDTGFVYDPTIVGVSSGSAPSFSGTIGVAVIDGTTAWISKGTSVQNLGIATPTAAPSVANIPYLGFPVWAANTYIWPNQCQIILDSNGNIQLLTTGGTTGGSVPVWATGVGATTTDGGTVWTCQGTGTRATTTAYTVGQFILASWTTVIKQLILVNNHPTFISKTLSWKSFFKCVGGGTSSSTATANLPWSVSLNSTTMDGTVTWQNCGLEVTRTNSANSAPTYSGNTGSTVGNLGNTFPASGSSQAIDSNGNLEGCIIAGPTQASAPTWPTLIGATVTESGGPTWQNQGNINVANTGTWVYAFSYGNSSTGDQSTASPLSIAIVLAAGAAILVSGPGSPDTQVDTIFIYRSTQGQATPFLLATIPAPTNGQSWQFLDVTKDPPNPFATLNVLITAPGYAIVNGVVTNYNDPPPAGFTNLEFHAGRLWGTVGNIVYYSTGPDVTAGNGTTAFGPLNFFEVPGTIFRLWPTTVGLYLFTVDGLWIVTGLGTSTNPFSQPQLVDPNISVSSYDAFTTNGAQANVYTNDRTFLLIDAQNGTSNVGFPVQSDLIASYSPASVYVTWYSNGLDQKGFITNGSNSWLNYMPAPAPETGFLWNTPATLVSSPGVVAVQSVETSPGLFNLLVGPSTSGPILKRDLSVFTDNGSSYSSNSVVGSVVLAHHGQMAGVAFIGLDAIRTGTQPGVSVLLDEFQGMGASPAFTSITNPINDPPNFPASATIFNSRYWLIQSGTLCYCRHMQIDFTFGSDTVQNELLSYTIYGTSISEE